MSQKFYTLTELKKISPLKPITLKKRFATKNLKKWGIVWRRSNKKEKMVSEENVKKYFMKPMKGFKHEVAVVKD